MATNKEIRDFFNAISQKKFKKPFRKLNPKKAGEVRRSAVRIAFRKKRK